MNVRPRPCGNCDGLQHFNGRPHCTAFGEDLEALAGRAIRIKQCRAPSAPDEMNNKSTEVEKA